MITIPNNLLPSYADLASHRTHDLEIYGWYDETAVIACSTCNEKIIELNNPDEKVWQR